MTTNKIELINTDTSQVLEVIFSSVKKDFVEVAEIINQYRFPYLLQLPVENLVTLLDLTGVIPYEIWYFDAELKFKGKAFSLSSREGNYRIQTRAKYMLLWKREGITFNELREFPCEEFQFVKN